MSKIQVAFFALVCLFALALAVPAPVGDDLAPASSDYWGYRGHSGYGSGYGYGYPGSYVPNPYGYNSRHGSAYPYGRYNW